MAGRQDLFGKAALGYSRRGAIYQRPNLRAMSSVDDLCVFAIYDDHRQGSVVSLQLSVVSGQWSVVASGRLPVDVDWILITDHYSLTSNH